MNTLSLTHYLQTEEDLPKELCQIIAKYANTVSYETHKNLCHYLGSKWFLEYEFISERNSIILYTIVDIKLAKFLETEAKKTNIPCFGALGDLILNFSKLLHQRATHIPSGQHILNKEYYERIEAIQFTMNHDDGNSISDINKSDIILLGVSRSSKTPTSIYLANRGFKTSNVPLINEHSVPEFLKKNPKLICVVGLTTEPNRLIDIRKNRMTSIKEQQGTDYTSLEKITNEIENAKKTFKKYQWPVVDVTRKSVEETAASIIKIYEIKKNG